MSDMPDGWFEEQRAKERAIRAALPPALMEAIGGVALPLDPTSESPTHPDAPRADGETPDIAPILATVPAEDLALVEHLERCTHMHVTSTEYDQVNAWADRRNRARVLLLRRMASLLARHRDGERLDRTLRNLRAAVVTENPEWDADDTAIIGIRVTRDVYDKAMSSTPPATPPAASPEPTVNSNDR